MKKVQRRKVVKRVRRSVVVDDDEPIELIDDEEPRQQLPFCKTQHYFEHDCAQFEDLARKRLIRTTYERLYGKPSPRSVNLAMVKLACSVRMLYDFYKETGVKIPAVLIQRKEACDRLDFERLDQPLKDAMKYNMIAKRNQPAAETEEGNTNMKKNSKTATTGERKQRNSGKTMGLGIGQTYAYLFEQNEKLPNAKKLTDEQMVAFMNKEFPAHKSNAMQHPAVWRRNYNANKLAGTTKKCTSTQWKGEPKAVKSVTTKKVLSKKVVSKKK